MTRDSRQELYQQVIIAHNKKPYNYRKIDSPTHRAEGYNPLCGDHIFVYLMVNQEGIIEDLSFEGDSCAICRASASMMTQSLKGKQIAEAKNYFDQFHQLITGTLNPEQDQHILGKLAVFSGIWHFPSRVKCASLAWHTLNGALDRQETVSTE